MNLVTSARYARLARLVLKLPTYSRVVWGIVRDPRTPIGLKGMLLAALAYVVMPVDLIPDAIPIIGQADDLTVLLLVLDLFIANDTTANFFFAAEDQQSLHEIAELADVAGPRIVAQAILSGDAEATERQVLFVDQAIDIVTQQIRHVLRVLAQRRNIQCDHVQP